jgi:hypothetical protein
MTIGIGTELWSRNSRDPRAGWQSFCVIGETRQSWLLDGSWKARKVNKKTMLENNGQWGSARFYTAEQKDAKIWSDKHRYAIARAVEGCTVDKLKRVAELLELNL